MGQLVGMRRLLHWIELMKGVVGQLVVQMKKLLMSFEGELSSAFL